MEKQYKIDVSIYDESSIAEAIEDFKEVGTIDFADSKLSITGSNEDDIEEIFNEFMNYIIGLQLV